MKKLLMALAVVCSVAISNAAIVDWKWTGTMTQGYASSASAYAGTVYIFNANTIGQQAVLTAFAAGGDWSGSAMDNYTTSDGKMAAKAAKTIADPASSFSPTRTEGGDKVIDYYYASVVTYGGKNYLFLSSTSSEFLADADDTRLNGSLSSESASLFESTTFSAGGWYSAVPEPTSGLMLLLGVGLMALKRRRS